jgi:hypothetical protein
MMAARTEAIRTEFAVEASRLAVLEDQPQKGEDPADEDEQHNEFSDPSENKHGSPAPFATDDAYTP